jgi:RND family efflux transporter MFP subunit
MAYRVITPSVVSATVLVAALMGCPASVGGGAKAVPGQTREEQLERFRKLSPEARLRLVGKTLGDSAWQKVARGDVVSTIAARGHLFPEGAAVYCRARTGLKGSDPLIIRWVIDDGAKVKKGDPLVELDDSPLQQPFQEQRHVVAKAQAAVAEAAEHLRRARRANEADLQTADLPLADRRLLRRGTEIELKLAAGNLHASTAALEVAKARMREIEEAITHCFMSAPQDGVVEYYVPEQVRNGGKGKVALVAQGEPVREGQLLLRVYDLKQLTVATRIAKGLIEYVRVAQSARMTADAFPARPLTGKVLQVDSVADSQSFLRDGKVMFRVRLSLAGDLSNMQPWMSTQVNIVTAERQHVIRVPPQAILHAGTERLCYVRTARGVEERPVVTGLANDRFVEIREGLQAGDELLRDPHRALNP